MDVERRAGVRYPDDTEVKIEGTDGFKGRLSDLSIVGLRAVFEECPDAWNAREIRMSVLPRQASGLPPFELAVAMVWKVRKGSRLEAGFRIISSPNGKDFEHYIDYLSFLHAQTPHAD